MLAIPRPLHHHCHQFDGNVDAMRKAFPDVEFYTTENATGRTKLFLAYPNTNEVCLEDWLVQIGDGLPEHLRRWEFEKRFALDPEPDRRYCSAMKVWHDGEHWVVAESAEQAAQCIAESGLAFDVPPAPWTELPAGQHLTIHDEVTGDCSMLACGWADRGPGYLGSVDY